jgi:hypothetical protein
MLTPIITRSSSITPTESAGGIERGEVQLPAARVASGGEPVALVIDRRHLLIINMLHVLRRQALIGPPSAVHALGHAFVGPPAIVRVVYEPILPPQNKRQGSNERIAKGLLASFDPVC